MNTEAVEDLSRWTRLRNVTDLAECWAMLEGAGSGSRFEQEAGDKYFELADGRLYALSSFDECMTFLDTDVPELEDDDPLLERAEELFAHVISIAIQLATDTDHARQLYDITEEGSELEAQSILLELELCKTVSEALEVMEYFGPDSKYGRLAITSAAELIEHGASHQ